MVGFLLACAAAAEGPLGGTPDGCGTVARSSTLLFVPAKLVEDAVAPSSAEGVTSIGAVPFSAGLLISHNTCDWRQGHVRVAIKEAVRSCKVKIFIDRKKQVVRGAVLCCTVEIWHFRSLALGASIREDPLNSRAWMCPPCGMKGRAERLADTNRTS